MKTKFLFFSCLLLVLLSCSEKKLSAKRDALTYIDATQFVGNPADFQAYQNALFIAREAFLGDDEDFKTYVSVVNDQRMQKGYFGKKSQEVAWGKAVGAVVPSKYSPDARSADDSKGKAVGAVVPSKYSSDARSTDDSKGKAVGAVVPSKYSSDARSTDDSKNPSQSLVADAPHVARAGYFAGQGALQASDMHITDSFSPYKYSQPSGVPEHKNDGSEAYLNWQTSALEERHFWLTKDVLAGKWARNQIGKSDHINIFSYENDAFFYCFQLVYSAYKNQGFIHVSSGASWGWLSPMDLVHVVNTNL